VLASRRRVLGERHSDTTVSAWNLVTTLLTAGESEAAVDIGRASLAWLLAEVPARLSADQRAVKEQLERLIAQARSE
jgi:hypothetical protein